jgi:hypothetical protein
MIGNLRMASFAEFGSLATPALVTFTGTPRDKLAAQAGLALAGSALLIVGTLASLSTLVAASATLVVTFAVFSAAVLGPNAGVATAPTARSGHSAGCVARLSRCFGGERG